MQSQGNSRNFKSNHGGDKNFRGASSNNRQANDGNFRGQQVSFGNHPPQRPNFNNRNPQNSNSSQPDRAVAEGSKYEIEVNYLDLILNPKVACAYHYDVVIIPDRPKKFMRPAFDNFCKKVFPKIPIAYDGKASCYSIEKLNKNRLTATVTVSPEIGKPMELTVTLMETKDSRVDLTALKSYQNDCISEKPMRALQCLEVALAQPCHGLGVRSGRSFYYQPKNPQDLGSGYELWYGLFQSMVLGERPLFNIDVSHKAFTKPLSVIEFVQGSAPRGNDTLKNKEIIYTPPKSFNAASKTFKLHCLGNSADTEFFRVDDKQMSVKDYYSSKGYEIQFPFYKLLKTINGTCYPMELCRIAPGQSNENSSALVVSRIVRYAASNTLQRKSKIMELFQHFHGKISPIIEKFGVSFGEKFIRLEASRLFAPKLSYRGGSVKPFNGKWNLTDNLTFLEPAATPVTKPIKWAVINFAQCINRMTLENCKDKLVSVASSMGISLEPKMIYHNELGRNHISKIFEEIKSNGCQFALIILAAFGGNCSYANVKQSAELEFGVITQCVKSATIQRHWDHSTVSNIVLKLNSKLNGVNHKVDSDSNSDVVSNNHVMFVGADVTHPSPQHTWIIPSVVGVVSSTDSSGSKYNMQHFYQESRKEIIVVMKDIMVDHLKLYAKNNKGILPTHIFYYRDGVADGQFAQVKEHELVKGMEFAFTEVSKGSETGYKPKLICIIVQKRNHTRLFPLKNGPSFGKMLNVFPGTVVDKVICHPKMKEFFLVSHESGLGTAKPAKYIVIRNDANVKLDDIQKITYNLCHLFPRCNKAVSYPAPAYLAHLVAARGKVYIEGDKINMNNLNETQKKKTIVGEIKENNPMFFV